MQDLLNKDFGEDIAYSWLMALFPTEGSAYGAAFATVSGTLMFLGALLIGFFMIVGIVSSAHSGKVLGEKYHQIWAPLRVVIGFGMMLPISGGYSAVHYALRDIVGPAAINLGNWPIEKYIDHLANYGSGLRAASLTGPGLVDQILQKEVCAATWLAVYSKAGYYDKATTFSKAAQPDAAGASAGMLSSGTQWDYGVCGSITYNLPEMDHADGTPAAKEINQRITQFSELQIKKIGTIVTSVRKVVAGPSPKPEGSVSMGEYFATKAFDEEPSEKLVSELITKNILPANLSKYKADLASDYDQFMAQGATGIYADSGETVKKAIKERIEKYGFVAAGSYERELSRMSGIINELANHTPQYAAEDVSSTYAPAIKAAQFAFVKAASADSAENIAAGRGQSADGLGMIDWAVSLVFPNVESVLKSEDSNDPVGDMISLGHRLLAIASWATALIILADVGWTAKAAWGAASIATANAPSAAMAATATALGAVGGKLLSIIGSFIVIMAVVGVVHAYVLPMIPMIMVFLMAVSWIVLFLEAAIASVLWAFAFIRMDGQDFFDRNQAPGVTLLFNLFLRPALGMLAFIGGLIILPALLNGLNKIWLESYDAQVGAGGWLGLFKYIVGLILFTYMQWQLTIRIFGMIPTIADRIGHWTGFGSSQGYGEGAETSQMTGILVAGAATTARTGAGVLTPSGGGGGPNTKSSPERKTDTSAETPEGDTKGGGNGGGGGGDAPKGGSKPPNTKMPRK